MKEMPKTYDHQIVESKWYEKWEKNGYFHAQPNPEKTPFTIVIPPPNITGKLHRLRVILSLAISVCPDSRCSGSPAQITPPSPPR